MGSVALAARGPSARLLLEVEWDFPLTAVFGLGQVLGRDQAFEAMAGEDPRPLLILRECESCRGTDDALLGQRLDVEKTCIMAQWFHAVKMPPEVLDRDNPLHEVFAGDAPPHLLLCLADGSEPVPLKGDVSRKRIWKAMTQVLRRAYRKDPVRAVSDMRKLLDQFDRLDEKESLLDERWVAAVTRYGTDSPKLKKLDKERGSLVDQREKLVVRGEKITDLGLKTDA